MIIQEWIFQSSLEEEKHASSVKALKIWKAQCPDAPWNYKKKQAAARRSRVMNTNVESTNTEKEALLLNSPQEMDT